MNKRDVTLAHQDWIAGVDYDIINGKDKPQNKNDLENDEYDDSEVEEQLPEVVIEMTVLVKILILVS